MPFTMNLGMSSQYPDRRRTMNLSIYPSIAQAPTTFRYMVTIQAIPITSRGRPARKPRRPATYLHGTSSADNLSGLGGVDILEGWHGNDILDGGAGNDALLGDAGDDTLTGGTGNDWLNGGSGSNTYNFSSGFGIDVTDGQAWTDFV